MLGVDVGARVTSIVSIVAGAALVIWTVGSAIKTVILPRAAASTITRAVFLAMRRLYLVFAPASAPYERRDRVLATYAPVSLVATLLTWLTLVLLGYALILWGDEHRSWAHAFELSGSSLLTLGIVRPASTVATMIVFSEAAIGLFLLALLITYLPSIYSTFSRREFGVTALEVRAGAPPSGREMIWRYWALERFHELSEVWTEWERWFVDIEETHTSLPALVFFRSPQPDHSWVTAAGAVLDGAALSVSTTDVPRDVKAEFCMRAGYLALRRIAAFFNIPFDPEPSPDDPISVTREEWEEAVAFLESEGVPIKPDRERAWRAFAGWRVNYDTVLLALCDLTSAPPAPWSSDRVSNRTFRPKMFSGGVH
jgi:hypothetical protein